MGTTTVKIDGRIANAIRKKKSDLRFKNKTISGIVTDAARLFLGKTEKCFRCLYHQKILAGIEIGWQSSAFFGGEVSKNDFVAIDPKEWERIKNKSKPYGRPAKNLLEQAIMEHLMRPVECSACPVYEELCNNVKVVENKE